MLTGTITTSAQADNVISFEEAKRASASSRSKAKKAPKPVATVSGSLGSSAVSTTVSKNAKRKSLPASASGKMPRVVAEKKAEKKADRVVRVKTSKAKKADRQQADKPVEAKGLHLPELPKMPAAPKPPVSLKEAARKRNKAKADKQYEQFEREFGAPKAQPEPAARAAVYATEMGHDHKRAFNKTSGRDKGRMGRFASSFSGRAAAPGIGGAPKLVTWFGIVACLVMVCFYLYPMAQQYYVEVRNHDKLQAEYDAIAARNDTLQTNVDYLNSDAGVEDAARQTLGWVMKGEQSGTVTDLASDEESESDAVVSQIVLTDFQAPDTWYSGVLDAVFAYDGTIQARL